MRVLGPKTVELLSQDHLPDGVLATASQFVPNASGYGLGFSVALSAAAEGNLVSPGPSAGSARRPPSST